MNHRHSIPWLLNSLSALDCVAGLTTGCFISLASAIFRRTASSRGVHRLLRLSTMKAISPSPSALDAHGLNRSFAKQCGHDRVARHCRRVDDSPVARAIKAAPFPSKARACLPDSKPVRSDCEKATARIRDGIILRAAQCCTDRRGAVALGIATARLPGRSIAYRCFLPSPSFVRPSARAYKAISRSGTLFATALSGCGCVRGRGPVLRPPAAPNTHRRRYGAASRGFLHRVELPHWPMIRLTAIVSTLPQIIKIVIAKMETLYAWPRFAFQAIFVSERQKRRPARRLQRSPRRGPAIGEAPS
jgi:hypothetical protein